jgi:hypothetical protein
MNIPLLVFAALPFFGMLASAASQESPFACNRLALTAEQRKRHFDELSPQLRALAANVRELPDGYEFEFPGDAAAYQLIVERVAGERLCCPFFDIDVRLDREAGPARLRLTGRPGTKEFIRSDFARWFKPDGSSSKIR